MDDFPPQHNCGSREALRASINRWVRARGYAFVSRQSTKEKTGRMTVTYVCDRAWTLPLRENRQRNTTSRGTSCPFSVTAK